MNEWVRRGVVVGTLLAVAGVGCPVALAAAPDTCAGLVVTIAGTEGADDLTGTPGTDVINGGAGDDRIDGLAGGDVICGGAGNDLLRGGKGKDVIVDSRGRPDLRGGPGNDQLTFVLVLDDGPQSVSGGPGDEDARLTAVTKPDGHRLRGAHGTVNMRTGVTTFRAHGTGHRATVTSLEGVMLPNGIWAFQGTGKDEYVAGGLTRSSRLLARTAGGDDTLFGSPGDDRLYGGPGHDEAFPDLGVDRCRSIEWTEGACERS